MRFIAAAGGEAKVTVAFHSTEGVERITGTLTKIHEVTMPRSVAANVLAPIGLTASAALGLITCVSPGNSLSALALGVAATILGGFGIAHFFLRAGNGDLAAAVIRERVLDLARDAEVQCVESAKKGEVIPALPAPTLDGVFTIRAGGSSLEPARHRSASGPGAAES